MRQLVWHACDQPNCSYKAKSSGHLKTHKAFVPSPAVTHGGGKRCQHPECTKSAQTDYCTAHLYIYIYLYVYLHLHMYAATRC